MRCRTSWALKLLLAFCAIIFPALSLLFLNLSSISQTPQLTSPILTQLNSDDSLSSQHPHLPHKKHETASPTCATVEEMGNADGAAASFDALSSLRVRTLIQDHFRLHGAFRVRGLPQEQFCRRGFVLGKASEAGFGNEMYKILTAAGLSIMLNRSLIIGQTRRKYPFDDYVSYTKHSFTLKEVKHLWKKNDCLGKYKRRLNIRIDDFEKPSETNVLCSNWGKWKQPIVWFQGTTDAVALQFFLKNVHEEMRRVASVLFSDNEFLQYRPNTIGELMRVIISPSENVEEAVKWALNGGPDPHIALHMRMLNNRPARAVKAALNCIKKALVNDSGYLSRPRIVIVSDTPSIVNDITPKLQEFAEVVHFDHKMFRGNLSSRNTVEKSQMEFRVKDWGPAPRWVAFVDFFLASRAKHAVVSGASRRVGTTYAQLIAALAAARQLGENHASASNFTFFSSFHSNILTNGLRHQVGWGHVWNRFAGPLSCDNQPNQCAITPLLPPGWWDGIWQSPILRDMHRMEAYGVKLHKLGKVDTNRLQSYCKSRKDVVRTISVIPPCSGSKCR
ncbi:uncharacterized protein LOC108206011 isoform X1 [Daucus carota subsp. sativus]|uniref:uncharacterized protein LOC108206011 isoform X1 n=1 Tax=Daucus carota subsp. sativus TaxID=79200 RepID=UPI0007EF9FB7|nr:PREDICTED: uncharacterized protein LOC108206011 isoform X1 [Daucus carota subsp. sativus]